MKIGLLIVDMQNGFINDQIDERQIKSVCEYINYVSGMLRASGHTVIHIQDVEGKECDTDPKSRDIISHVVIEPGDIRVEKEYSNAFWKTDLEQILRSRDVKFVVVSGFAAEHCVTFTTNGAIERGFQATILQNGILSTNQEALGAIYRDRPIISYPAIEFMTKMVMGK